MSVRAALHLIAIRLGLACAVLLLVPVMAAAQADASAGAKGVVLLLGVKTYEPGTFSNLTNPCQDIEQIESVLRDRPEFEVFDRKCDLTADEIRTLVIRFHDRLGDYPTGSFGMIYFAGHGIALGEDVLLFGKQAKVSSDQIKTRAARAKVNANGEAMKLVSRDMAVTVLGDLSPGETAGVPVIIVVDACRSTPLAKELGTGAAGSGIMRLVPHTDTLVAFSAAHSSEAVDSIAGLGMSPYAYSIREALLRSEGTVAELFTTVRRKLRGILRARGSTINQVPAEISALESPVCVGSCDSCEDRSRPPAKPALFRPPGRSTAVSVARASPGFLTVQYQEPAGVPRDSDHLIDANRRPASETLWYLDQVPALAMKLKLDRQGTMRMDVFWCDYGEKARTYERASAAARTLVQRAQAGTSIGDTMLSTIRLRRFSMEQNSRAGYHVAADEIRFTPNSEVEKRWTEYLRTSLIDSPATLIPRPTVTPTPGYMSVFFCDLKP